MDDLREWLSDNLRYFELGGAIILILLILIFGIRSCGRRKSSEDTKGTTTSVTAGTADTAGTSGRSRTGEAESTEETAADESADAAAAAAAPLVEADQDIRDLVVAYYAALGSKDADTIRAMSTNLSSNDEAAIRSNEIGNYVVIDVYSKAGRTDDTLVTYVKYTYQCPGIATPVPGVSWLYLIKSEDSSSKSKADYGGWKIQSESLNDQAISDYVESLNKDADVAALMTMTRQEYEDALAADPALKAYLDSMGRDTSTEDSGETSNGANSMKATANLNVRSSASSDSDANIIGMLYEGETITKTGEQDGWVQFSYNGQTAYVFGEYLTSASAN